MDHHDTNSGEGDANCSSDVEAVVSATQLQHLRGGGVGGWSRGGGRCGGGLHRSIFLLYPFIILFTPSPPLASRTLRVAPKGSAAVSRLLLEGPRSAKLFLGVGGGGLPVGGPDISK